MSVEKSKPVDIFKTNVVDDKNMSVEFPVVNPLGESMGFSFLVVGAHSDRVRNHVLSVRRKNEIEAETEKRRGNQRKPQLSAEAQDEKETHDGAVFASKFIVGWVNVKQEFSEDILISWLKSNQGVAYEIIQFGQEIRNFMKPL